MRYRVVFFCPRPGRGWRIPFAALVSSGRRDANLVLALHMPDAACVGGVREHILLQLGVDKLRSSSLSMSTLPVSFTDHFQLGLELDAPSKVDDVPRWIQETALPRPVSTELTPSCDPSA